MTRLWSVLISFLLCSVQAAESFSALSPPPPSNGAQELFADRNHEHNQKQPLPLNINPPTTPTSYPAAVLLNTNARGVSEDLVPIAEAIFGKEFVHVTTSEEEGKLAAAKMVQQNVSMVIPVGGDGTLSSMVNFLCDAIREKYPKLTIEQAMEKLPYVAYIPLGTGNGVGSVVGSPTLNNPAWKVFGQKRRTLRQVQGMLKSFHSIGQQLHHNPQYFLDSQQSPDVIELPMMEVSYPDAPPQHSRNQDTLCFFAGAGFDSLMLQDFQSIKKWAIRRKILTKTLSSVAGYCVALIVKTLPKCVGSGEHNIQVKLTTRDPETLWVDHRRGDVVQKVGPSHEHCDTVLYEGTTGIIAGSTSPFYGGGLRLFPFARLTKDKMHLRLGRIHPLRGFFNIPKIFEGSFRDRGSSSFGCLDYIGADFDVHVTSTTTDSTTNEEVKGFPVQHSGESVGYFEKFRLRVIPTPVRFITLMEKRIVIEEDLVDEEK